MAVVGALPAGSPIATVGCADGRGGCPVHRVVGGSGAVAPVVGIRVVPVADGPAGRTGGTGGRPPAGADGTAGWVGSCAGSACSGAPAPTRAAGSGAG